MKLVDWAITKKLKALHFHKNFKKLTRTRGQREAYFERHTREHCQKHYGNSVHVELSFHVIDIKCLKYIFIDSIQTVEIPFTGDHIVVRKKIKRTLETSVIRPSSQYEFWSMLLPPIFKYCFERQQTPEFHHNYIDSHYTHI